MATKQATPNPKGSCILICRYKAWKPANLIRLSSLPQQNLGRTPTVRRGSRGPGLRTARVQWVSRGGDTPRAPSMWIIPALGLEPDAGTHFWLLRLWYLKVEYQWIGQPTVNCLLPASKGRKSRAPDCSMAGIISLLGIDCCIAASINPEKSQTRGAMRLNECASCSHPLMTVLAELKGHPLDFLHDSRRGMRSNCRHGENSNGPSGEIIHSSCMRQAAFHSQKKHHACVGLWAASS